MSIRSTAAAALALTTLFAASACGSGSSDSSGAAATSSPASAASSASGTTDTFPVTVTHAFGTTTIEKKPERIATLGWGNHEVPLALGVVPVGMSKATWGDDNKNGILPWVEDKIKELGGQTPVLFDDATSIDYEAVANTKPDVILAAYSGLTKEQYDKLSKIAPVVAYPKTAWATSLTDMVTLDAKGMGRSDDGAKLASGLEQQIKQVAEKHPALKGKRAMFTYVDDKDLSKVGFYGPIDPRAQLLDKIGMKAPKVVAAAADSGQFFNTVSAEKSDQFSDVDMIITYCKDAAATLKTVQGNKLWAAIPAVKNGAVACLPDDTPVAAATNPSPLDISWGLEKYLAILDTTAAKVK